MRRLLADLLYRVAFRIDPREPMAFTTSRRSVEWGEPLETPDDTTP